MNLERNKRIAAFRKVSGYLLWLFTPLLILAYLGGIAGLLGFWHRNLKTSVLKLSIQPNLKPMLIKNPFHNG